MPKRTSTTSFKCGHEGCNEWAHYQADNRKERINLQERYGAGQWRCTRHKDPERVLSVSNLKRVTEQTSEQKGTELYWKHSGFISGPGFVAWANDFPAGTTIRVTAEIILPGEVAND